MPARSNTEHELRSRLHGLLSDTRSTLQRFNELPKASPQEIDTADSCFRELAEHLATAAATNRMLRELEGVTADGLLVVGATDMALLMLHAVLSEASAELDHARLVA